MRTFNEFVQKKSNQVIAKVLQYMRKWLGDTTAGFVGENSRPDFSDTTMYTSETAKTVARSFFERKPEGFCEFISKYGQCEWTYDGKGGAFGWVVFLNQNYCAKFTFDHEEHYYAEMLKGQSNIVPVVETFKGQAESHGRPIYVLAMKRLRDLTKRLKEILYDRKIHYWLDAFFLSEAPEHKQFWAGYTSKAKAFRWPVFVQFTQQFKGAVDAIDENDADYKAIFELMARAAIRFNIVFLGDFAARNIMTTDDGKPMHIDLQFPRNLQRKFWN